MDGGLIQLIAQTGGTLGLAIFAIAMLNRVWEDRVKSSERYADDLKCLNEDIRQALDRNTEVMTRLSERLEIRHVGGK